MQNEKYTLYELEYGEKTEKRGKWDAHMPGPGIWREKVKNVKNEKYTLYELEYRKNTEKHGKWDTHIV